VDRQGIRALLEILEQQGIPEQHQRL
jgi:hypothetical protein